MRVHFIAIGGSAMHNLAIALSKKGYKITGSDDTIFDPSYSNLKKNNLLPDLKGWDPTRITSNTDAVILGMHARLDNPELLKAQEIGLKIYSYPEYIYEQSKDKLRIVIGGSHGKTTITSMILHVLKHYNKDFDYLVGAQLNGFETMVKLTDEAPVIILEGDEYLASPIDRRPKFHLYHAHIGVISGISWDHVNVFPTLKSYYDQFAIYIDTIEKNGTVIYCEEDANVVNLVKNSREDVVKKGYSLLENVVIDGVTKIVTSTGSVPIKVFGDHNILNLNAAKLVCEEIGISESDFLNAIQTFKGASKRLESLGNSDNCEVFKDFAHSPSKLKATIDAVKSQFPLRKLIAVIELHTFSSLNKDFLKEYAGTMNNADEAIIFIDNTNFLQKRLEPYDESVVKLAFDNKKVKFFNNAENLEGFLTSFNYKGKNLLLMSSGHFSGMNLNILAQNVVKSSQF